MSAGRWFSQPFKHCLIIDDNALVGGQLSDNRMGSQTRNKTHLEISSKPEILAILNAMPDLISPPRRICLVRLSALGDVCLVVPLVRVLQRAWPSTHLTWVIGREALPLVEGLSDIEFLVFDKRRGMGEYLRIGRALRKQHFDVLLALQASLRVNLLYPLINARRKIGFDRRRAKDGHGWFVSETIPPSRQHFVDAYLSFARQLGLEPGMPTWDLPLPDSAQADALKRIAGLPRPLIVVNPASSKAERNWPVDRYATVIEKASARWRGGFVLTGGPSAAERNLSEQIVGALAGCAPVVNATGTTTLPQLLALLAEADVVVSPDTGPAHLADAMGTPVVGLYAVAPAALSGPYRSRHLTVDKFDEAAQRFLGQKADTLPWNSRVHHPEAIFMVTVEDILAKVGNALTAPPPQ